MSALNITALSLTRLLQMQLPWAWTLVLQPMLLHGLHWLTCRLGLLDVSSSVPPPPAPRTAMALSLSHTLSLAGCFSAFHCADHLTHFGARSGARPSRHHPTARGPSHPTSLFGKQRFIRGVMHLYHCN